MSFAGSWSSNEAGRARDCLGVHSRWHLPLGACAQGEAHRELAVRPPGVPRNGDCARRTGTSGIPNRCFHTRRQATATQHGVAASSHASHERGSAVPMSGPDYGGLPREFRTVAWRQAARRPSLCALVRPQPPQEYEYEDRSRQESRYGCERQNRPPATVLETSPCGNCSYGKQPQRDGAIGLTEGTTRIKAA